MEPRGGRAGGMGRGGDGDGEGLFMSGNTEDPKIGVGFCRSWGMGRQEGTEGAHGARWEQSSSFWDEPWEQLPRDESSLFGVSRQAQGGFGTPKLLPSRVSPRTSPGPSGVADPVPFPKIPVSHHGASGPFVFQVKSQSWIFYLFFLEALLTSRRFTEADSQGVKKSQINHIWGCPVESRALQRRRGNGKFL